MVMEVKVLVQKNPFRVLLETPGWVTSLVIDEKGEMLVITRSPTGEPDKTKSMAGFPLVSREKGRK